MVQRQIKLRILSQHNTSYSVILNMVSPVGQELEDFAKLAVDLNIPLCPISIGNRKDFFRAQNIGLAVQEHEPESKATKEVIQVYNYINQQIYK